MKQSKIVAAAIMLGTGSAAVAQGIPVFDTSTFAQTLATVRNTLSLIDQGREQISEAQRLYASMNKLTNVNSYGAILNLDSVRNLLPPEARDIERMMSGDVGSGDLATKADRILHDANLSTNIEAGSDADRAYLTALEAAGKKSAASAAVADTAFDVSSRRTEGLEDLRLALDSATDAKEVADLQARIAVETAHIQNDQNKLQAVAMRRAAQQELDLRADDARLLRDHRATFAAGE